MMSRASTPPIRQSLDFRQSAAASTKLQQGPRRDEKNQIPAMIALLMLGLDVRGACDAGQACPVLCSRQ
jgi:hypothetical protein